MFEICGRTAIAIGLCNGHWLQQSRGKQLAPLKLMRSTRRPAALVPHPTDLTLMLVPLTRGHFALISAVDAVEVGQFNWQAKPGGKTFYAVRHVRRGVAAIGLHNFIAGLMGLSGDEADHENRNGLDCRRSNLRPATRAENCQNRGLRSDSTSGVKGVSWNKAQGKYFARVMVAGRSTFVGAFADLAQAQAAVAEVRERLHGAFANHGN